jgi:hypothetical protein
MNVSASKMDLARWIVMKTSREWAAFQLSRTLHYLVITHARLPTTDYLSNFLFIDTITTRHAEPQAFLDTTTGPIGRHPLISWLNSTLP